MCGIIGYVGFSNLRFDSEVIQKMTGLLKSRGPDDHGMFFWQNLNMHFWLNNNFTY